MSVRKRKNTVILVSGFKRSGKDFVSNLLKESLTDSVVYSYATPLKKIMADTLNISLDDLDSYKNDNENLYVEDAWYEMEAITSFRSALQVFGTEAMKPWFGDAVWSDVFVGQDLQEKYIIISDWRFNIEYEEACKYYDKVITLRVKDDNIVNTDTHASETELENFNFDYTLDNTKKDPSIIIGVHKFIEDAL